MYKHKHRLSTSPCISYWKQNKRWPGQVAFVKSFHPQAGSATPAVSAHQDQMNTPEPSSSYVKWSTYLPCPTTADIKVQKTRCCQSFSKHRRTPKVAQFPGIHSSLSLLVSHPTQTYFFMDQTAACCSPNLLSSVRFCNCVQITQKAWRITH